MSKRIVIIGAVAAGASAAAKARRISEDVEIVLVDSGSYMSFANCGLPYYVGGEVADRESLFEVKPKRFSRRFNVDVRLNTAATAVDVKGGAVTLEDSKGGTEKLSYDRLILATGAVGIRPPVEGIDADNIFTVRTVPDADAIVACLQKLSAGKRRPRAVVIGGGYIGLETVEQLLRRGLDVTVIEMADQLMLALDAEMAEPLRGALAAAGAEVILSDALERVSARNGRSVATTESGREVEFDVGILAVGVRPNVQLAKDAGVALGETGAIRADEFQRTSRTGVYAAGDNCEARHLVLDRPVNIPLAGPANKAGRVAGANAALDLAGAADDDRRRLRFNGVLGTAIVRVCGQVVAVTGITESQARREKLSFDVAYMLGPSHAEYYPGAEQMLLKVVYARNGGRLLGAQAVGGGVDKRIDVLATAITAGMTVEGLEQLDLCYAPPFGSAKDVAILAGYAAANARRGEMPSITPAELLEELAGSRPPAVIDVRTPSEFDEAHLDGAVNIPVDLMRQRLSEVPEEGPVVLYCTVGYRSYAAQRILMNNGRRNVRNLLGGFSLIQQTLAAGAKALTR